MRRGPRSSSRRGPLLRAACVLALLCPSPAPAQDFLNDLFGGDERSGPASPTRRPALKSAKPREHREPVAKPPLQTPKRVEPHSAAKPTAKSAGKTPAKTSGKTSSKPPPEPAEPPPPPYDAQVQRLAEVLGGLSFLRDLCGDGDGDDWRDKMARLRDADAPAGSRRQRLTAAFNRGYHGYELTYRVCTPNARLVIARYLDEAENLSRDVASRYGNP
ncbi:MAG: TIGR02301 family protein [Methylocystis sp.]